MILYSNNITPRLQYIVDFFSKELFDEPMEITTDKSKFIASEKPRINYSDAPFSEMEFYMKPVTLLFETGVQNQNIDCFELNFHKAFYQSEGDFPFDIFAASFYLLSRYEEYLPHEQDAYGRYAHTNALAYKENFLNLPLVNIWLGEWKQALKNKFPTLLFKRSFFRFIPTYDIDVAYSYLHKGWARSLGGLLKSVIKGHFKSAMQRIDVLLKMKKDPYDAYEWLDSLHLYCRQKPYYFFLVAKEQKGYDKNISPAEKGLQDLIHYHAAGYTIGIHPSWQSHKENTLLKEEIEWLEYMAGKKMELSRQHYIKMSLPETYQNLIQVGIRKDFSMGYGSINGFRASVASSFLWYDLSKEQTTSLEIFPFCFMDANSFYEQKFKAEQTLRELMEYYNAIKKVNGLMITIWHNHFLGTDPLFAGWREVYEVFLKEEVYWD